MAFKMKGSPFARNYGGAFKKPMGENHNGEDHDNTSHKDDVKAVKKAKGTDAQGVNNLLNVLNEVGSGGKVDNYTKYANRDAERKYYEDSVKEKDPDTSTYGGRSSTGYRNSEGGEYISQMDAAVDSEKRNDELAASEKAAGNWYDESRGTSVEGREMAQADAVNEMVKKEATDRVAKNVEGASAQARIDTKAAEDAEEARVASLTKKQLREEEKAAKNSAMPKSGFKMQRKGNYGK